MDWLVWLYVEGAALQHDVRTELAAELKRFATTRDWLALAAFLPMGIALGVVHAMTPGHSKTVLASYVVGSGADVRRAVATAFTLAMTHITMSVLIVLLSLPLVSRALGDLGTAPFLADLSRVLLAIVGGWLVWQAWRGGHADAPAHDGTTKARRGFLVGLSAGLIPCPVTFLVMTFAVAYGVPLAGVAFSAMMLLGVALTLALTALIAVFARRGAQASAGAMPSLLGPVGRALSAAAGVFLILVGVWELRT